MGRKRWAEGGANGQGQGEQRLGGVGRRQGAWRMPLARLVVRRCHLGPRLAESRYLCTSKSAQASRASERHALLRSSTCGPHGGMRAPHPLLTRAALDRLHAIRPPGTKPSLNPKPRVNP